MDICANIKEATDSESIISYEDAMYDTLKEWWKIYKVKPIPKGCLEYPAIGIVIKTDEIQGAVFLYEVAPVKVEADHIIVNPSIRGEKRKEIQSKLLKVADKLVESMGYSDLFFIASNKMLINTYKSLGFEPHDVTVMKRSL